MIDPDVNNFENKNKNIFVNNIINKNYIGIGVVQRSNDYTNAPNPDLEPLFIFEDKMFLVDQDLNRIDFFISKIEKINYLDKISISKEEKNKSNEEKNKNDEEKNKNDEEKNKNVEENLKIELEKVVNLEKKIFLFDDFKNYYYSFDNLKKFLDYIKIKRDNLISFKKGLMSQFENQLPLILKHSRDQKFHNNVYWDSQNYNSEKIYSYYCFLFENKYENIKNLSIFYKINFPYHLEIWNSTTKKRIIIDKEKNTFENIFFPKKKIKNNFNPKILNEKIQMIKQLNSNIDNELILEKFDSESHIEKINTNSYDKIIKKIKKDIYTTKKSNFIENNLKKKKPIIIKIRDCLEKKFELKNKKNIFGMNEFLNLNFSNKYILNLTFVILLESSFYILPELSVELSKYLNLIFSKKLNLIDSSFLENFQTNYNKEYFLSLEYFKNIIPKISDLIKKEEKKRFVENIKDKNNNYIKELQKKRCFKNNIFSRKIKETKKKIENLISENKFDEEKLKENFSNQKLMLSTIEIDIFIILSNQLYQRISHIWNILEKVYKDEKFKNENIKYSVEEFTKMILLFSFSIYVFPDEEINKKNCLESCFLENFYLLHNLDDLLSSILDFFTKEIFYSEIKTFLFSPRKEFFKDFLIMHFSNEFVNMDKMKLSVIENDDKILKLYNFKDLLNEELYN